ncbi:MAG: mechanosensitive ion channel [Rhodocyclaceae bacterium]|nr:mechanosensitive ion channel [Rhodocyclaceae bacterium]
MEEQTLTQLLTLLSFRHLVEALVVVALAALLIRGVRFMLDTLAERYPRARLQLGQSYPAIRLLVWTATVVFIVLVIVRPPDTVIFAMLGSLSLALGLAAQDGIRNLIAGVVMIFNPPFRTGDMIQFGGHYGEVVRLDLSATWLQTFDDNTVMIPNAEFLKGAVANSNSGALDEMVVIPVDLPWPCDIAEARAIAADAARASPYCYLKKPVAVAVSQRFEHGQCVVRLTIKAYVVDVRLERVMASDITERALEAIERAARPAPV